MPRQTVESIKSELLKIPVSAYNRALHAYNTLKHDPHADQDQIALYAEVVSSLLAAGYAPDPATGAQGPAVKAYYESQVLGTDQAPAPEAPTLYRHYTDPFPPPRSHATSSLPSEPPDPYIE